MKIVANTVLPVLILIAIAVKGFGQTYQFSTPISGGLSLDVADWNSDGNDGIEGTQNGGFVSVNFNALNETITYDAVNNTFRQVGYITLDNSATTAILNDTRGIFTSSGNVTTSSATVTVQQNIVGGVISFDSGTVPVNSQSHFNNPIQISGSYSLDTGGQTYTGDFSPTLHINNQSVHLPYLNISQIGPNSITLSGAGAINAYEGVASSSDSSGIGGPVLFASVTADNGFDLKLYSGTAGTFDPFQNFSLTAPDSIIATVVPEPGYVSILCFGAFVFVLPVIFRKIKKSICISK